MQARRCGGVEGRSWVGFRWAETQNTGQKQGASFGQHLLRYRLERACERLAHPGALAKEVAYAVGFNDLSYFTWAFKRQLGLTPSEYRAGAR